MILDQCERKMGGGNAAIGENMNRRTAREQAFYLIFESFFQKDRSAEEIYETARSTRDFPDDSYVRAAFFTVMEKRETFDAIIEKFSHGWRRSRISAVSLAAMELSIYEMCGRGDVPAPVSINEALELVKTYDDEGARAFVNGILNAVAKEKAKNSTQPIGEATAAMQETAAAASDTAEVQTGQENEGE